MTQKQMEKWGFFKTRGSRYTHPHLPFEDILVFTADCEFQVFQKIYEEGKKAGIKEGKEIAAAKLKELLNPEE